jgi:hypothetical protein
MVQLGVLGPILCILARGDGDSTAENQVCHFLIPLGIFRAYCMPARGVRANWLPECLKVPAGHGSSEHWLWNGLARRHDNMH